MERLLQDLGGVLRLTAITGEALLRLAIMPPSGFGVSFDGSCGEGHGVLLCSHDFRLSFGTSVRYMYTRTASPIPTPSAARHG